MYISSQNPKKYTKEDKAMIIMDLKIDNFFAFRKFHMNMSYPKKIVDSYIKNEYLKDRENFRYKKVNILMGSNATGKTSIGQMLMTIFNFIDKKEADRLVNRISNKAKTASFSMDFVAQSYKLYRIEVTFLPANENGENPKILARVRYTNIHKRDSYETCIKKIEEMPVELSAQYMAELEKIEELAWLFSYPADLMRGIVTCSQNPQYTTVLEYTLRALDSSIQKVEKIDEVENAYVIRMESRDLIIQDGEVIKNNILSSGTKAGIDIAYMVAAIYAGECGFYYCDEKFSYIHSDIEKAFLSVMIELLNDNEQLFFTTHNMDVLELPLPKHSFQFLRKDMNQAECPIKCVSASEFIKRNTDSLKHAVDNDLFSVAPDAGLIYKIADLKSY